MNDASLNELRVLTAAEASDLLTVSVPVMERWRRAGTGPRFIRLSVRRVGYRLSDLRAWIAERAEGGHASDQEAA
jgi:predicted DNA-binding transcriptional regulator AlpA